MKLRVSRFTSFGLTVLVSLAIASTAAAQGGGNRGFGGKADNDGPGSNRRQDDQSGNRDSSNRDRNQNGFGFGGGSDVQKVQDAIGVFQGNQGQQPSRRGAQGQFRNNQQGQNVHQHQQGNWPNQNRPRRYNSDNWAAQFGGAKPFSNQWYHDHPQAWHYHHHQDDNVWAVATAAGVLSWLGWGAQPYPAQNNTVIYQPLPAEVIYVDGQPPVYEPNAPGQWMTVGVYSLMTGPEDDGTRIVQLLVDKHGNVRGNHFDTITNASHNITGRIHQPTQQVQWTLESNKQLVFFTPLDQLTQPMGVVYVKFPGGMQQQWQLARMEDGTNQ
jgi:hypothetical protein